MTASHLFDMSVSSAAAANQFGTQYYMHTYIQHTSSLTSFS